MTRSERDALCEWLTLLLDVDDVEHLRRLLADLRQVLRSIDAPPCMTIAELRAAYDGRRLR